MCATATLFETGFESRATGGSGSPPLKDGPPLASRAAHTRTILASVKDANEDFEWYPTTQRMMDAVARWLPKGMHLSILDIGAGDGRVLVELAKRCEPKGADCLNPEHFVDLYAIEKSTVLIQAQPDNIVPLGTDLFEQNLACLPVDYVFSNPPYSQFDAWASLIIESGHAKKAFLIIPQRWKESKSIANAIKKRGATTRVIHSDDFLDADRRSRAVVDIVEISFPRDDRSYGEKVKDPFDIWFDQNINTFDREAEVSEDKQSSRDIARIRDLSSISELVAAFNEEYAIMETNYRAIFKLDYAILKELGVNKEHVRSAIKLKMAGLKTKYWQVLFERLDSITQRLSTETKKRFIEKLTKRTSVAFTATNAYAVVIWAIKNANQYYNEQLTKLFRDLSTHDGVLNYKSNQRAWQSNGWRYLKEGHSHYTLDYRIVLDHHAAIKVGEYNYNCTGNLDNSCHELLDDVIAVFSTLGYTVSDFASRRRNWTGGTWEDFTLAPHDGADGRTLFQVKGYKNGNLHFRFLPEAIKLLNVTAGRLLGWLTSPADVVKECGYSAAEAEQYFRCNIQIAPSSVKLLLADQRTIQEPRTK